MVRLSQSSTWCALRYLQTLGRRRYTTSSLPSSCSSLASTLTLLFLSMWVTQWSWATASTFYWSFPEVLQIPWADLSEICQWKQEICDICSIILEYLQEMSPAACQYFLGLLCDAVSVPSSSVRSVDSIWTEQWRILFYFRRGPSLPKLLHF